MSTGEWAMCKNAYTYNVNPKYKQFKNIPPKKCINIVFNKNHPNMVIEFLTEIAGHLIQEESLDQFFMDLDIAKNAINIVNVIKTFAHVKDGNHFVVIDHADLVFNSYISSPAKSWRRDILKQWDDFLNYITAVSRKNTVSGKNKRNIGIILLSDIPIEYGFIQLKYRHEPIDDINYSKFIQGIPKLDIKTDDYKHYNNFERDINYIRDIYEMYSTLNQENEFIQSILKLDIKTDDQKNYNNCKRDINYIRDIYEKFSILDKKNKTKYYDLLKELCKTDSENYLFADRGFLLQEYGYNKLLLEIITTIENKNPDCENLYLMQRMNILKGNIYYYNYPEDYHQALACYTEALKLILKDYRENTECGKQCSIMPMLIYYEMMSVFYHLVKDNRLNYLNSHEIEKFIQIISEIIAEHTTKTHLRINRNRSASERLRLLILIICEVIFEKYKMILEMIQDCQEGVNHRSCLLNPEMKTKEDQDKLSEAQLVIARFIVISLKLSEILPLSIIERLKFITKVLALPVIPVTKNTDSSTKNKFRKMLTEMVTPCQYVTMIYSIGEKSKYKYWSCRIRKKIYFFIYQYRFWLKIPIWPLTGIRITYHFQLYLLKWQIKKLWSISKRANYRLRDLEKNPFWHYLISFHSSEIMKNTLTMSTKLIDSLNSLCTEDLQLLKNQELKKSKSKIKRIIEDRIKKLQGNYDFNEHKGLKTWRSARIDEMIGDFKLIYSQLDEKETINSKNEAIDKFLDAKMKYVKINSYSYAERVDNKIDTLYKELERMRASAIYDLQEAEQDSDHHRWGL